MAWVRIDDAVLSHPKLVSLSNGTCWIWLLGIAYANRHLTDGRLAHPAIKSLGATTRDVRALVAAGLWEEVGDGWQIHDYADYQPTRAQVESGRAAARDRMAKRRRNGGGQFA